MHCLRRISLDRDAFLCSHLLSGPRTKCVSPPGHAENCNETHFERLHLWPQGLSNGHPQEQGCSSAQREWYDRVNISYWGIWREGAVDEQLSICVSSIPACAHADDRAGFRCVPNHPAFKGVSCNCIIQVVGRPYIRVVCSPDKMEDRGLTLTLNHF
jgi:hypothetical protein